MPRKPTRRSHLQKPQPGFSRLGRSMALVASSRKVKQQIVNSTGSGKDKHDTKEEKRGEGKDKHDTKEEKREEESHSSSSEEEDTSSQSDFEGVQADFAFFDPKPDDFHGVKVLLKTYLDNKEWDLSSFVDLILQQTTVGTVIKIEGDEDNSVYGFVSALNVQRYKDYMMEVKEFLLKKCEDKEIKENLKSYFEELAADVGLLISQRVVNLPPQLLPPMYDSLFDEISWATEDEPTKELRKSFCFKYYLLVSKIYKLKNEDQKKKGSGSSSSEEATIYVKAEDEILHNLSAWSFTFPLRSQQVTTNQMKEYQSMGLVMAVEATRITSFRQQLHLLIDES